MSDLNIYLTIILMAVFTYATRIIPLIVIRKRKLGERTIKILSFIPVSILTSLLVYDILFKNVDGKKELYLSLDNDRIIASLITLIIGYTTKNFYVTVIGGILSLIILRQIIGY